ncbi:MAG: acetate/propionate family kinase [Candidatus Berkiella sp.]
MSNDSILVINAGSSSIKFSLFGSDTLSLFYRGQIEQIHSTPTISILDKDHHVINQKCKILPGYESSIEAILNWIIDEAKQNLKAVGHRVVHGGQDYITPTEITHDLMVNLSKLIPLAPLHEPHNLKAINIVSKFYSDIPQVACFDTAFHSSQLKLATLFAIPRRLSNEGIIRYGFHGLSYEYIASVLPQYLGKTAHEKVIVAHLGNGASMCGLYQQKSMATSMGFTALDGLMMGKRCGNIDPGVILYLLRERKYSLEEVTQLLYEQSGLLGVSEISNDVRQLEHSQAPHAKEALALFCFRAAQELCALAATLKGCDAIVFTAGIGENSSTVRKGICEWLDWLGVEIDDAANQMGKSIISQENSKIRVCVIPTNEEYMIARHTHSLLNEKNKTLD